MPDIYVNELWIDRALTYEKMRPCKHNLSLSNDILGYSISVPLYPLAHRLLN